MFDGRWHYWARTIEAGRPLDEPIPKIEFDSHPHAEAQKNIKDCVKYLASRGHGYRDAWMAFVDWLLWGFGTNIVKAFPQKVSEDVSWYWYRTFNLGLMLKYPADHMAWGSCEIANMAHSGNGTGYFPTPQNVVKMMTKMVMTSADKTKAVCDPCLGTGRHDAPLEASNYSLRLYGQDISLDMCKMATVNAWCYIPWLTYTEDGLIEWHSVDDYKDAIKAIEDLKTATSNSPIMIDYKPKTNSLVDWM